MTFIKTTWNDRTVPRMNAAQLNRMEQGIADAHGGLAAIPLVTVLPTAANSVDGQMVDFLADAASGVVWRLRYRAASPSIYKWEFVGGPPLGNEQDASDNTTTLTAGYAPGPTPGPAVTALLPGEYYVDLGTDMYWNTTTVGAVADARMSFAIATTAALDADAVRAYHDTHAASHLATLSRRRKKTITAAQIAAGGVVAARYRNASNTSVAILNRWLSILPIRVGA